MWRRLVILLAALAGTLTGATLAVRSERVANNLRGRIEALAAQKLALKLEIAALHIGLWPPRLRFEGVRVTLPDESRPALTVRSGAVSIRPWPSATGAVALDVLELEGVHADVRLAALTRVRSGVRRELRSPVDVETLRLTDAEIHVEGEGWRLDLDRADASMTPSGASRREVNVEVRSGSVQRGPDRAALAGRVRAMLHGSVDRPLALGLESAHVSLADLAVDVKGGLGLEGSPALDLELSGEVPLPRLRAWWHELPPLDGTARIALRLGGSPLDPALSARCSVRDLTVAGRGLGDLELEGRLDERRIRVDSFALSRPASGKVTGSGTVELARGLPLTATLRLHDVSFPVVLELSGLHEPWVDGQVSGDLDVRGRLEPFALTTDAALVMSGFRSLDRGFRTPGPVAFLRPDPIEVHGRATIGTDAVVVDDATVTRGASGLDVQGSLSYDPARGLDLHASGDDVALAEVGPIGLVDFGGHGAIAAVVQGPYADPTVSGTVTIDGLSVAGWHVGDTRATLVYSDFVLRVDRATGRRGGGTFVGAGQLDFHTPELATEVRAQLHGVALEDLLASFAVPREVRSRVHASVDGALQVAGPLLRPKVEAELEAPSLTVDASNLGPLSLRADYDGDTGHAAVAVQAHSDEGEIRGEAGIDAAGQLGIDADFRGVSLGALASLMGGIDIQGRATGKVHLGGPRDALTGRIEAASPDLTLYATSLGRTSLVGEVEGGDMRIAGSTAGGVASLRGGVQLSRELGYELTASFADLDLARLWPALDWLDVSATGSASSRGLLSSPASMLADVVVERGHGSLAGIRLEPARPIRLEYAGGALHVLDFALAGPGTSATLDGKLDVDGRLELSAAASVALDAARASMWRLTARGGVVRLGLTIGGTWQAPYLYGDASVDGGVLRLRDSGQTIEDTSGRVVFAGRTITVDGLSARTGGGEVTLAGQVVLPPGRDAEIDLQADIDEVMLRPSPQLSLSARGDLRLLGERKDLSLTGDLEILSLRYTANLDLEKLIPRRNAPPLRVSALEMQSPVRLGVHVSAADNVIVTSPVLEAELHADVTVTGTTDRMGLVGSVTPLWARARYQENVFDVERASILFTDEYRVFTQFDLRARTQACDMQITVDIQGSSDGYNVVPSGVDDVGPVSPQDILACLQLGIRLRDLNGPEGNLLSDRLTSTSLDALWAVSGLDQQVRRLLPMVDELRVSSGWSQRSKRTTTRIVVGKELGQDLQLTYSRALDVDYDQVFSVAYKMSELATVLGTWNTGTDAQGGDFGLDLRLRWEFQ